jgi:hypothetical protein
MLTLQKGQTQQIIYTGTELAVLTNPYFLFVCTNNVTEKEGDNYLRKNYSGFFKIDLANKKELLDLLKIGHSFLETCIHA